MIIRDFFKNYFRRGLLFKRCLKMFEEFERYSPEEIKQYQDERLRETVKIAYENVPFYRKIFEDRRLIPSDIIKSEDLHKLPVIGKDIVRNNFQDFRNKNFRGVIWKGHTSGTTGSPAVFLRDLYSINIEHAIIWRHYQWAGKSLDTKQVTMRGETIIPSDRGKPPFWKNNHFSNELVMSSYHLSDKNMPYYVEEIEKYKPYDLNAYPSAAYLLANFCRRVNADMRFSVVFTTSEMLLPYQRQEIEKAFKCKIFDRYGTAERVAVIGQCDCESYHELPAYGISEYLPNEDGKCDIVGTTLHNSVMPLIRYKTGDLVTLPAEDNFCACGKKYKLIQSIYGRDDDMIILADGRKFGRVTRIFMGLPFIKEGQIIQHRLDFIEVKIVPTDEFSIEHNNIVMQRMYKYLGKHSAEYKITVVEKIERTKRGKFKVVYNLLDKK